jgi:hypothetical protein
MQAYYEIETDITANHQLHIRLDASLKNNPLAK